MIYVVDYNAGNLKSVETALHHIKADFKITKDPQELRMADRIIFPGVGHARSAMDELNRSGMGQALQEFAQSGKPFLGICLGSQIIFDHSEEGNTRMLGIVPGKVKHFPKDIPFKIPQIGWNTMEYSQDPLMEGIDRRSSYYFVHSYYVEPGDSNFQLGTSNYGIDFCSAVAKDNIRATQFHPEKSGRPGLRILKNFMEWEI